MQTDYIFVYGSLLSGFKSPAYEYISRYFEFVANTSVTGTLYDMGAYPVGTPKDTGHKIYGELYKIRKTNELSFALAQLDGYEGLNPEEGETTDYKREIVAVDHNGNTVQAWVYWYNHEPADKPIIASGDIREYFKARG